MKRWIIRGFFIGLLLLSILAWAWGTLYYSIVYRIHSGTYVAIGMDSGALFAVVSPVSENEPNEIEYMVVEHPIRFWPEKHDFGVLGFRCYHEDQPAGLYPPYVGRSWHYTIPYWCPALLLSLSLWLVWRKTRSKTKGRAFPVEVAKVSENP